MTSVSWHPLARRELFEASAFYEGESQGLGEVFLDAVQHGVGRLESHPRAGRRVLGETRRYLVSRFPYSIFYRMEQDEEEELVFILAIAHDKRRPRYWAKRI